MDALTISFIAVGLAMDAFAVSVASGMIIRQVQMRHALKFGLFFGVFQFMMPVIGWLLGSYFATYIAAVDHWVAFGLLAVIGGRMIWEAVTGGEETDPDCNEEKLLSLSNMTILAVATSIDALAVGISFAVVGVHIWSASLVIGAVAFLLSAAGIFLGKRLGCLFGRRVEIFGGALLIGIGLKILLEHLLA